MGRDEKQKKEKTIKLNKVNLQVKGKLEHSLVYFQL